MTGPGRTSIRRVGTWTQRPEPSVAVECIKAVTSIALLLIFVLAVLYFFKGLIAFNELGDSLIKATIMTKDALVYGIGHAVLFGVIFGKMIEYLGVLWLKICNWGQSNGQRIP
jgi:hypothetical protein